MIKDSLEGKKIAITGSTGFLGTALVELLLRVISDVQLRLLIRPSGRRSPQKRLERDILRNDAFNTLKSNIGNDAFEKIVATQIKALPADISEHHLGLDSDGMKELSECDVIIHSAAAVSFDEPLDRAAEVNLMGPVRLVETLNEFEATPHLVMVSTCYVAGNRKGKAPERPLSKSPFYVPLNWREETEAARRTRSYTEDDSRRSENLEKFRTEAKEELGAPGISVIAGKTEQIRERWVKEKMVHAGRERATSLGFPDAYAFTKAMAEQAVQEIKGDIPLSIVRPSIIESSWQSPVSGWIRGFRMAEPIILNFGRGTLKEFPGIPEGIIESELFGHKKGSFTGAGEDRKGYFELANKGTIFLDEIGELPKDTQAKLLRVIESGEFMRVGESKTNKVDARIIAATNRNLLLEIQQHQVQK